MDVTVHGFRMQIDESYVEESVAEIARQVREYEAGTRTEFDLTVSFPDSFTGRVMRAMAAIPHGETRTYGDLAAELDSSAVAVGQACGRNPVPVVVPCHRVVGANDVGGFSSGGEDGVTLKRRLLAGESAAGERQSRLGADF